jgi:hypothetical protein
MADTRASDAFKPRAPNEARIIDYLLGGKDNFAADREAAEQAIAITPELPTMAMESRKFLGRAVRFLAGEGIRQFIDIACGLPTQNNAHEVAQAAAPDARVIYVDNDPVVVSHASAILAGDVQTGVIQADMREPDRVLAHPDLRRLIDLDEPVAILLVSAFTTVSDDEVPLDIVGRLREAIAPESWMVISHPISDSRPHVTDQLAAMYREKDLSGAPRRKGIRSRAEVELYFDKLDLADPGVVHLPAWRPGLAGPSVDPRTVWAIGGVGRKA